MHIIIILIAALLGVVLCSTTMTTLVFGEPTIEVIVATTIAAALTMIGMLPTE